MASTWKVGPVSVTRIEEQLGTAAAPPEKYFRGFEREVLARHLHWLAPNHYDPKADRVVSSVHSWLIRTPRQTVLLDCCAGNHKARPWTPRFNMLDTPFLERLRAAGARPEDIDVVLCTHLHADHVGWNTVLKDGRWVPTFPNAKYVYSRTEGAYWDVRRNPLIKDHPQHAAFQDSVLPVVESGQALEVEDGYTIEDGMVVEAAPGHTPGHVLVGLAAGGQRALFCGDAIHHAIQIYAPHWNHAADERPEQAQLTRRRMLERCVTDGSVLFPTHFGAPHVTAVRDDHGAFTADFIAPEH